MMSEDESSMQEPSTKLDSSDDKAPTGRVSITHTHTHKYIQVDVKSSIFLLRNNVIIEGQQIFIYNKKKKKLIIIVVIPYNCLSTYDLEKIPNMLTKYD